MLSFCPISMIQSFFIFRCLSNCKRGISPVVATTLLIIVTVVSVIGFYQWYDLYSEELFVEFEGSSSTENLNIEIEGFTPDNILYVRSPEDDIRIDRVAFEGLDCDSLEGKNLSRGINMLEVEEVCLSDIRSPSFEIFVQAEDSIDSLIIYLPTIEIDTDIIQRE